jgi:hypothetical protein
MLLPSFAVRGKDEVPSGMAAASSTVADWLAAAHLHVIQRTG